jgi:hypothetical protein
MSKLYSEYAVEKAFNSDIVTENKVYLLILMISCKILSEIIALDFDNNYIINFPPSLLGKPKQPLT